MHKIYDMIVINWNYLGHIFDKLSIKDDLYTTYYFSLASSLFLALFVTWWEVGQKTEQTEKQSLS